MICTILFSCMSVLRRVLSMTLQGLGDRPHWSFLEGELLRSCILPPHRQRVYGFRVLSNSLYVHCTFVPDYRFRFLFHVVTFDLDFFDSSVLKVCFQILLTELTSNSFVLFLSVDLLYSFYHVLVFTLIVLFIFAKSFFLKKMSTFCFMTLIFEWSSETTPYPFLVIWNSIK